MEHIDKVYCELENLLKERPSKVKNIFKNKSFILFGAGNLGIRTLKGLRELGIEPIAFGDNNDQKINQEIEGIKVLSKKEIIQKYGSNIMIILTVWGASTSKGARVHNLIKSLKEYGFKNVLDITKLYINYHETFLPHYCMGLPEDIYKDKDKILECYKLFEDEKSKIQYYEQVRWRLLYDNWDKFIEYTPAPYFQDDIYRLSKNDIIYDCGAFDGDTIKDILNERRPFKKIIAFEPDSENYKQMLKFVQSQSLDLDDKIEAFEYAIGEKEEIVSFESNADASSLIATDGNCNVKCVSIDNFVKENKLNIPTVIKMDIEGFEEKALIGAKNTIQKYKPVLCISAYHKPFDLWQLPILINTLNCEYKFYLRHHIGDCWETVLYAVPKNFN